MDCVVYKTLTGLRWAKSNTTNRLTFLTPVPKRKMSATLKSSVAWPAAFCLGLRMCSRSSFTEFFPRTPWKGPLCCLPTPIWGSTVQKKTEHSPIKSLHRHKPQWPQSVTVSRMKPPIARMPCLANPSGQWLTRQPHLRSDAADTFPDQAPYGMKAATNAVSEVFRANR